MTVQSTIGNAIKGNPLPWHTVLIGVFIVGISVWLVEQNVGQSEAFTLATVLLLGIAMAQRDSFTNAINELGFK